MTFRFFCPQGHILEAEPEQVGQAAACPFCGTAMLIPAPFQHGGEAPVFHPIAQPAPEGSASGGAHREGVPGPDLPDRFPLPDPAAPGTSGSEVMAGAEPAAGLSPFPLSAEAEVVGGAGPPEPVIQPAALTAVFHIPCPQGHILETPQDMLGTEAMCPFCRSVFRLDYEASQEYRAKLERERELAERREAAFWLRLAIVAAVLVLAGLIAMIAFAPR